MIMLTIDFLASIIIGVFAYSIDKDIKFAILIFVISWFGYAIQRGIKELKKPQP